MNFLVCEMSENSEKGQSEAFKCLVLSDHQSQTQIYSITYNRGLRNLMLVTFERLELLNIWK